MGVSVGFFIILMVSLKRHAVDIFKRFHGFFLTFDGVSVSEPSNVAGANRSLDLKGDVESRLLNL